MMKWATVLMVVALMAMWLVVTHAQPRRSVRVVQGTGVVTLAPGARVAGIACAAATASFSTGQIQCFIAIEE